MSPVDTAWLRMDRENHLMAIKGVLVLDRPLAPGALEALLRQRLLPRFPRFAQRVVQTEDGAWWEHDPHFDLSRHLCRRRLPPGDAQLRLQELISRLAAQPLDPTRPLWAIEVLPRYRDGSALVVRLHHCMADGLALVGLLRALSDPVPADGIRSAGRTDRPAVPAHAAQAGGSAPDCPAVGVAAPSSPSVLDDPLAPLAGLGRWLRDPEAAAGMGRLGGLMAAEVARLLVLAHDSPTRFKGRTGRAKALAWSAPLPLWQVKALAAALGCSVNDVLLSCAAGALRRHLLGQGDDPAGAEIRTLVPVNLRPGARARAHEAALGNRFGMVPLLLPLHEANPVARVLLVGARMSELKSSLLPPLSLGLIGLMGLVPKAVQDTALQMLSSRATAVVTHVPGPRRLRHFGGARIEQVMFWVPQSGDMGLGVSIFSYGDSVSFGLITDAGLVPDPASIMPLFAVELENLLLALLLHGPQPTIDPRSLERQLRSDLQALKAGRTTRC